MTPPTSVPSLVALLGVVATIAGLVGYGVGAGEWKGQVSQILVEHERRLNAQAARDDRQDAHMEAIDDAAEETRTALNSIKFQVSYLFRQARGATMPDDHP